MIQLKLDQFLRRAQTGETSTAASAGRVGTGAMSAGHSGGAQKETTEAEKIENIKETYQKLTVVTFNAESIDLLRLHTMADVMKKKGSMCCCYKRQGGKEKAM